MTRARSLPSARLILLVVTAAIVAVPTPGWTMRTNDDGAIRLPTITQFEPGGAGTPLPKGPGWSDEGSFHAAMTADRATGGNDAASDLDTSPSDAGTLEVDSVPAGYEPMLATVAAGSGLVYVSSGFGEMTIVNRTTTVATLDVEGGPPAYDPLNGFVYAPESGADVHGLPWSGTSVAVIDGVSVLTTIMVSPEPNETSPDARPAPLAATFDARDGLVYVVSSAFNEAGLVSIVNGTRVVGELTFNSSLGTPVYDPSDGYVYVPSGTDGVNVIDGMSVIATLSLPSPIVGLAWEPLTGEIYATGSGPEPTLDGNLSVISGTDLEGSASAGSDPGVPVADARTGLVYVPDVGSGTVEMFNGTTRVATIPGVPNSGTGAFDGQDSELYLSGVSTIDVIRGSAVVAEVPVGSDPATPGVDARTGFVYVPDFGSDNVSIIFTGYSVSFSETGLVPGTNWSVTLGGTKRSGTGPIVFAGIANGTYDFTVGSMAPDFTPAPGSGRLVVAGPTELSVSFRGLLGLPGVEGDLAVYGGTVVAAALGLGLLIFVGRRNRPPPPARTELPSAKPPKSL